MSDVILRKIYGILPVSSCNFCKMPYNKVNIIFRGASPMAIDQLTAKIYNKLSKANLAGAEGKVAVQFNLTGKVTGVFYIEILDGVPSVMPYEYIDHDAIVSGSLTNIEKIFSGKLIPQVAVAEGKIKIEGNFDKVMLLAELMK